MSPKTHRPGAVPGFTIERLTHCGKIFVTVTAREDKPFEVFIRFGKSGGCGSATSDGIARLLSYGLRSGLDPADAVKALSGIACHRGPKTCMNEVSEAIRLAMKSLETGADINDIMDMEAEEQLAQMNAVESPDLCEYGG